MTDIDKRNFEIASMGNEFARALCHTVLEVKADELAGENFKESAISYVEEGRKWYYLDDTFVRLEFNAQKFTFDEEGNPTVMYNPSLSFTRARHPDEYWPDMSELLEDVDDELAGELRTEDDESTDEVDMAELCYVQEVFDYYLEDEKYGPRKNFRREYYYCEDIIEIVAVEAPETTDEMLSEVIEEDIHLQEQDKSLYCSFSELDVLIIEAICNFDYGTIRSMLMEMGFWGDENDGDTESYDATSS